jgi:hypothetical protein
MPNNPDKRIGINDPMFWIEKNGVPERVSFEDWKIWYFNDPDRVVAKTKVGTAEVSTVFLSIPSNIFSSRPLLYETAVFDAEGAVTYATLHPWEVFKRSRTRTGAKRIHNAMVKRLQADIEVKAEVEEIFRKKT